LIRRVPAGSARWHITVRSMLLVAVVIVDLPFVFLAGMSFQPLPLLSFPTDTWSTTWYAQVFKDSSWLDAIENSLKIAAVATVVAVIAGGYLAMRTRKARTFTGSVVIGAALLPLIVPSVMYATGMFAGFTQLDLFGDWRAIALVHSVLALPYVYVNVLNGLNAYDPRWDQAAASLGASPARRLRKVTLPLLRPALITGAFLAALLSLDEFTTTLFLSGLTFQTLPLKFWSGAQENLNPELAVVGVLLTGFLLVVALIASAGLYLTSRASRRSN
jgi:ABC-type spermidine/putrescine transport system permease subunit II